MKEAIAKARAHFGLDEAASVVSCYEAGRDGFWLHRWLQECGVENLIVDSGSIEVNPRQRRAKTDRLDAYVKRGSLPDWEVPNMLAKYHATTSALAQAETSPFTCPN